MQHHERYIRVHKQVPYYFYLKSDSLEADIKWIEKHKIENIHISGYEPYNITSIEVLSTIKVPIKKLAIFIKNADLSGLKQYSDLTKLSIGEKATSVDLTSLEKLEDLYFLYSKNITGLETIKNMKRLTLINVRGSFFNEETAHLFQSLSSLQILSGELPGDLSLLPFKDKLRDLEIYGIKNSFDLSSLLASATNIEVLKIEKCRKVQNLELTLPLLKSLSCLSLIDSVLLSDTTLVNQMPQLRVLIVLGSSYFVNGNLEALKDLKWVSIDNKRHYNLKHEDLPKSI